MPLCPHYPLPWVGKVYGLWLPNGWEQDVTTEPAEDGVHHLLVDAQLFQLDKPTF